jgi:hypothetical protein
MFSIFLFFFILILKRSFSFTTIYFLYNLPFSYSKHVNCFRQTNLVQLYLIIFDAVVGRVGIFHSVGTRRAHITGRHFTWLRLWIPCAFYSSLLFVYTITSFFCFWICPLSCPQNMTQCFLYLAKREKAPTSLYMTEGQVIRIIWRQRGTTGDPVSTIITTLQNRRFDILTTVSMKIEFFWDKISYQLISGTEDSEGLPASIFRYEQSKQIRFSGNIKSCDFGGHSPPLRSNLATISVHITVLPVKFFPSHVMKVHRGRGCTAPLILNPGTRWR